MTRNRFLITIIIMSMTISALLTGCGKSHSNDQKSDSVGKDSDSNPIISYERKKELLDSTEEMELFDLYGMELEAGDSDAVENLLNEYASFFGLEHCIEDLSLLSEIEVLNEKHYKYQQWYDGLPVYGKGVTVTAVDNKAITVINNTTSIEKANTEIETEAVNAICETLGVEYDRLNEISHVYLYETEGKYSVVFVIKTEYGDYIIADATTGEILKRSSMIDTEDAASVELQGQTVKRTVDITKENNKYSLIDTGRNIYVYDLSKNNEYLNYDEKFNKGNLITFKNEKSCKNSSAVDALYNIEKVYDFYNDVLGHKSSDGKGKATIRIFDGFEEYINSNGDKKQYRDNAGAWGRPDHGTTEILIGPRQGTTYANDLDVMGHEFTHSIIHYTVEEDFISPEGNALNEGISDIMGLMIEAYYNENHECDWIIGDVRDYTAGNLKKEYPEYTKSTEEHDGGAIICNVARQIWIGNPDSNDMEPIEDPVTMAELWYRTIKLVNTDLDFTQCRSLLELNALNMYREGTLSKGQYSCVLWSCDQAEIKYRLRSGVTNLLDPLGLFSNAYPTNMDIFVIVNDREGNPTEEYGARVLNKEKEVVQETNGEAMVMNLPFGNYTIEITEKDNDIVIYRGAIRFLDYPASVRDYFLSNELNILTINTQLGLISELEREYQEEYLDNMGIPVEIYTQFSHFSDSKVADTNNPYTFWTMIALYATMEMDDDLVTVGSKLAERYRDEEQGEMLILSEEEVQDIVNVMMPKMTKYPDFPNTQYERPYKKDGFYYLPMIDMDTESSRMTEISINEDGTATAISEAFSYYPYQVYETYQVNLVRNEKINLRSPEPYPFCIDSIMVINSPDSFQEREEGNNDNTGEGNQDVVDHVNDMYDVVRAAVYTCQEYYLCNWNTSIRQNEMFWDMIAMFCSENYYTDGMDTLYLEDLNEYVVVPNHVIISAAYAMFPDFDGRIPEIYEDVGKVIITDSGDYAVRVRSDLDYAFVANTYDVNTDGSVNVRCSVYDDYEGIYQDYLIHMMPVEKTTASLNGGGYYYVIDSISRVDASMQIINDEKHTPYYSVVSRLYDKYGPPECSIISDVGNWDKAEMYGVCYLKLLDFNADSYPELYAICREYDEPNYTCFLYSMTDIMQIPELIYCSDELVAYSDNNHAHFRLIQTLDNTAYIDIGDSANGFRSSILYGFKGNEFGFIRADAVQYNNEGIDSDDKYYIIDDMSQPRDLMDLRQWRSVSKEDYYSAKPQWEQNEMYIADRYVLRDYVLNEYNITSGEVDRVLYMDINSEVQFAVGYYD